MGLVQRHGGVSYRRLQPYVYPERAAYRGVNLPPNVTLERGQLLGLYTGSADAVHTITASGTVTGGTYRLAGAHPLSGEAFVTDPLNHNAASAAIVAAIEAHVGAGSLTAGGGALPGTPTTLTWGGDYAGRAVPVLEVQSSLTGGGTYTYAVTTVGRTAGTAGAVGVSGVGNALYVNQYDLATDADGYISIGNYFEGRFQSHKLLDRSVDVYSAGYFDTRDLVGLTSDRLGQLGGRLWKGTLDAGVIVIPG